MQQDARKLAKNVRKHSKTFENTVAKRAQLEKRKRKIAQSNTRELFRLSHKNIARHSTFYWECEDNPHLKISLYYNIDNFSGIEMRDTNFSSKRINFHTHMSSIL